MAQLKHPAFRTLVPAALLASAALLGACSAKLGSGGDGTGTDGGLPGEGVDGATPTTFSPIVMRRLNRTEYDNTVRDLLGTALRPGEGFPTDDLGGGFPTVGAALSLSPSYVLAYEAAAHALIEDLFAAEARRSAHVTCDVETAGDTCARTVLGEFARKAWRRPVTEEEVTTLLHPLEVARTVGATPTEGLRHAMAAVLLSPHFIFKVEVSPGALDGFELATRLSYSLWGTMPDEALFAAAASGALVTDDGLRTEVERMLADPRAEALVHGFAARWLDYDDLENHEVNADLFAEFTPELAESMKQEANHFFHDALAADTPVRDLLTTSHTFVDEALSAHYGITEPRPADVPAGELWRVDGTPASRGGMLTLGALLTHTSLTSRTSPVKRGDFVFKHMLCGDIPPPPPEVEGLPDSEAVAGETLRQRMERHSSDPSCAGCHKVMDPIGFGLEHFDAIGRYRTHDGASEVNASGIMPDDTTFDGAQELAGILANDPRFPFCVTKHFMTYSLGSAMSENVDEDWATYLTEGADLSGGGLKSIITQVVLSRPFRERLPQ